MIAETSFYVFSEFLKFVFKKSDDISVIAYVSSHWHKSYYFSLLPYYSFYSLSLEIFAQVLENNSF